MSNWYRMEVDAIDHPKLFELAIRLGIEHDQARLLYWRLLNWASKYSQYGNVSFIYEMSDAFMDSLKWKGEKDHLFCALSALSILDFCAQGAIWVHGWIERNWSKYKNDDHARLMKEVHDSLTVVDYDTYKAQIVVGKSTPRTFQKYAANYALTNKQTYIQTNKHTEEKAQTAFARDQPGGRSASVTGGKKINKKSVVEYTPEFLEAWDLFPRKIEKLEAFRCWGARVKEGNDPAALIGAARRYKKYVEKNATEERYILRPKTFFGPNDRWREYSKPHLDENTKPKKKPFDQKDLVEFMYGKTEKNK